MSNSSYKKWHKPNVNSRYKQGYYQIDNKEKYVGDPNLIIYRSSWEFAFVKWCDYSPSVVQWSSEPIKIPYYDRVSKLNECKKLGLDPNNPRNWVVKNYHTDFWVKVDKGDGVYERWFVEIKPSNQLIKPVPPSENSPLKVIKRFNMQAREYLINEAKFAALNAWAKKNDMKFFVFTEKSLSKIIGRFFHL